MPTKTVHETQAADDHVRIVDPELLDFIPAELNHSDGELIDACRRLVNERVSQILEHFDILADELTLSTKVTLSHPKTIWGLSVAYKTVLEEPELLLVEASSESQLAFALAVRGRGPNEFISFEQPDEPWMELNFRDFVQKLDERIAYAGRKRKEKQRKEQATAVTALRRGKAVLAAR